MASDAKIWEYDRSKKLNSFESLLQDIEKLSEKERFLWKEIYDNAISDRNSSDMIFTNLYVDIQKKPPDERLSSFIASAKNFNDLLTRMEKSNAQLMELANMIRNIKTAPAENLEVGLFEELDSVGKKVG